MNALTKIDTNQNIAKPGTGRHEKNRQPGKTSATAKLFFTGICAGVALGTISCNDATLGKGQQNVNPQANEKSQMANDGEKARAPVIEIGKAYDAVVTYHKLGGSKNYSRNIYYRVNQKGETEYKDTFFDGWLGTAWMSAEEWKRRAFGNEGKKQFVVLFSTDSEGAEKNAQRLEKLAKIESMQADGVRAEKNGAPKNAEKPGTAKTEEKAKTASSSGPKGEFINLVSRSGMPGRILGTINEQESHETKKYERFPYANSSRLAKALNAKYKIKADSLDSSDMKNGYIWIEEPGKKFKAYFTQAKDSTYAFYKVKMFRETGFSGMFERLKENISMESGKSAQMINIIKNNADARSVALGDACALFATENFIIKESVSGTFCVGLGQLTLNTAYSVKDTSGQPIFKKGDDLYVPEKNAAASISYFRQQIAMFGSLPIAFAAYNTGPGSMKSYLGGDGFADQKLNNPKEYAVIGAFFARFFSEINMEALESMGVGQFMARPEYKAAYENLKQGVKGYLSGN